MRPLILNAGLYGGSAILLRLAGFVVFLWLAQSLPVAEYAAWGLLYALQTGIATFGLTGIVEAVIALLKEQPSEVARRELFAAANAAFFLVSLTTVVLATLFFIGTVGGAEASLTSAFLAIGSGVLLACAALQAQIVRLSERHMASLFFNFLVPLAGFVGSAVAFYYARSVTSYFAGLALGAGLALAVGMIWMKLASVRFEGLNLQAILRRLHPFILVGFIGWLTGYGSNYIVNGFFPADEVARFTFILSLSAIMQLVATSLNQVWNPRFYALIHSQPVLEVEAKNRLFFQMEALVLGVAGAAILLVYPFALPLLGGNAISYAGMRLELLFLLVGYICTVPAWHALNYLLAFDKGGKIRDVHVVTGIAGTVALVLLMWSTGPLGIYIGFLVHMVLRSLGLFLAARRHWRVMLPWQGVAGGAAIAVSGFWGSLLLA
jgi:O-antigen/teichoic acid export membrane protein